MQSIFESIWLTDTEQPDGVTEALYEMNRLLEAVEARFRCESDGDLIESCIYERLSLQARYRYLLRMAKKQSRCTAIEPELVANLITP